MILALRAMAMTQLHILVQRIYGKSNYAGAVNYKYLNS